MFFEVGDGHADVSENFSDAGAEVEFGAVAGDGEVVAFDGDAFVASKDVGFDVENGDGKGGYEFFVAFVAGLGDEVFDFNVGVVDAAGFCGGQRHVERDAVVGVIGDFDVFDGFAEGEGGNVDVARLGLDGGIGRIGLICLRNGCLVYGCLGRTTFGNAECENKSDDARG